MNRLPMFSLRITTQAGHILYSSFHARTESEGEMIAANILGNFHQRTPPQGFRLRVYDWNPELNRYAARPDPLQEKLTHAQQSRQKGA